MPGIHLHVCITSSTIAQAERQNATMNVQSQKGLQKPLRKRSHLGDKRRHPSHTVQMLPRSHKQQNATLHLPSSQADEHKSVHTLNQS